jgi:hypothetical protein
MKVWESYGTALLSVNAALADPIKAVEDETLASLFILSLFENISGQQLHIFGVHGSSISRLPGLRNVESLTSSGGQHVFKAVIVYLQIRNLSLVTWPADNEESWIRKLNFPLLYKKSYAQCISDLPRHCRC